MTTTTNLGMILVEQSQAQKEVTVNTALTRIDAILNTGAKDKDLATPPASPTTGDVYIVAASPTGAWSGQAGKISYFNQIWQFVTPREGMNLWVNDENLFYTYDGAAWVVTSVSNPQTPVFRNVITNGGFDVWQRGTSLQTNGGYQFITDRWKFAQSSGSGNFTISRQSGTASRYAARLQRDNASTSVADLYLQQPIEAQDSIPYRGKRLTFSIYLSKGADLSANVALAIYTGKGTDEGDVRNFTTGSAVASMSISAVSIGTSPTLFSITTSVVIPSDITQLGVMVTKSNSGTASANDWVQLEAAQLEAGTTVTAFERIGFALEYVRCRRYYQKSFSYGTVPAQNAGTVGAVSMYSHAASATFGGSVFLGEAMRTTPTITTFNPSAANTNWRDATNAADRTITVGTVGEGLFVISGAGGAAAANNVIHYTASAEM